MSQPLNLTNFDLEAYMSFFPRDSSSSSDLDIGIDTTTPPDSPFTALGHQIYSPAGYISMDTAALTSSPYMFLEDSLRSTSSAPPSIYQASAAEIRHRTSLLSESSLSTTPGSTSRTHSASPHLPTLETEGVEGEGEGEGARTSPKAKRRSQNRMAQQRFRERKEQEKAQLANRVKGLTGELVAAMQRIRELEAQNEKLGMELDLLRPWHRDLVNVMLAYPPASGGVDSGTAAAVTDLGLGEML
ncbi:hypothetical protein BJY00DRAFT_312112 [Aspergillus carlsbadensis]|nr:hypothetical protein BJY00DRAFT_312112 [Aspergillus carlsbadensis]